MKRAFVVVLLILTILLAAYFFNQYWTHRFDALIARQAAIYADAARACAICAGVTVWGFTDRHSWIGSNQPGFGAATLLDGVLRTKPAYTAFARALR